MSFDLCQFPGLSDSISLTHPSQCKMVRFFNDTRSTDPSKSSGRLEVIGAGLPRCATSSLQAALESPPLDFAPCMHMAHIAPYVDQLNLVLAALREEDRERRQKILHQIFDGYAATTDFPGIAFFDDLMDMYPDAQIVLNGRKSGEEWADSIRNSLAFFGQKPYLYICYLIKTDRLHYQIHQATYGLWEKRYGVPRGHQTSAELYEKHFSWAREEAAKRGKPVLEFQPQDGWKPLCGFLGKPMPPAGTPYPHLNDQRAIQIVKTIVIVRGLLAWTALGGVVYAGVWFGRKWLP